MKKVGIIGIACLGIVLAGCTSNQNTLPSEGQNRGTVMSDTSSNTPSSTINDSNNNNTSTTSQTTNTNGVTSQMASQIKITVEEAIKIYEKAHPNTAITSLELDTSFGTYRYEIKGVDDSNEYKVKINAETGDIMEQREERLDADEANGVEKRNEALDLTNILPLDEITKRAIEAVGQGEVTEWSLERELSTTYWEVKIQDGRSEVTVKLDAKTGAILETELDD